MKIIMFFMVSLILLVAPVTNAKNQGKMQHRKEMMKEMGENLNLTEEQKTKMKEIQEKYKSELEALRSAREQAHKTFMDALEKDTTADTELIKLHGDMLAKATALRIKKFSKRLEIRNLLTAEQKSKFKSQMKMNMEKMRNGMDQDEE